MPKYFYTRNDYLLNSPANKCFEEVLHMSMEEFRAWVAYMRQEVVYAWDVLGQPPRIGKSEDAIVDNFNKLSNFPANRLWLKDVNGDKTIIRNTVLYGSCVSQWFPTMGKVRISYKKFGEGISIYDYFARDDLFDKQVGFFLRHFKRDSFYHFSPVVKKDTEIKVKKKPEAVPANNGPEWIRFFEKNRERFEHKYDYWLSPVEEQSNDNKYFRLSLEEFASLDIPDHCKVNADYRKADHYQIRMYQKGKKVLPAGFSFFNISYCQQPSQYPPLTAKLIWEYGTEHCKNQEQVVVWDPSSGWAGRLIGALAVKSDRNLLYLGCDPNTDHTTDDGETKYHKVGEFFNTRTTRSMGLFPHLNEYKIWQLPAEDMRFNKEFQQYKGKLDFVFTSFPYFNREQYSEDDTQSWKRYSAYNDWVEGFLKPTIQTAYDWLKSARLIAINIADLRVGPGNECLPLEKDTCAAMESCGFVHHKTFKMAMCQMQGGGRVDENGESTWKNPLVIDGKILKYEPIFVYRKP